MISLESSHQCIPKKIFSGGIAVRRVCLYFFMMVVFFSTLAIGILIVKHKPLGNDEIHSQYYNVTYINYKEILLGKVRGDRNNCPLFYLLQKLTCQIGQFEAPPSWLKDVRKSYDPYPMILLRFPSILFIAGSVTLLFFYFSKFYSFFLGGMSVLISFSLSAVWEFMTEARPYALWIFLLTLQTLIFVHILNNRHPKLMDQSAGQNQKLMKGLIGINILLSLTTVLSMINIFFISCFLWFNPDKRGQISPRFDQSALRADFVIAKSGLSLRRWKDLFFAFVVPLAISIYYSQQVPQSPLKIGDPVHELIFLNAPFEHILIILLPWAVLGLVVCTRALRKRFTVQTQDNTMSMPMVPSRECVLFHGHFFILLSTAVLLIFYYILTFEETTAWKFFSSRYCLFLTAPVIVGCTLAIEQIRRFFSQNRWMTLNFFIVIAGLIGHAYMDNFLIWRLYDYFLQHN